MNIRTAFLLAAASCILLLQSPSFLAAQDVVINKVFNGGDVADTVELLVIKNNLDMRGMILRDFTPELEDSRSGAYIFQNTAFWQRVKAGTLIVCVAAGNIPPQLQDTVLTISLGNPTYFQPSDTLRTFNVAGQDMVMIKQFGASVRGTSGNIHAFAYGLPDSASVRAISPKLWIPTTRTGAQINLTPSGNAVYAFATSPTQSLRDFNGTGTGFVDVWRLGAGTGFGRGNTPNNQRFIDSLRRNSATSVQFSPIFISTKIFPNPASEYINVQISSADIPMDKSQQETIISCVDMLGKRVKTVSRKNTASPTFGQNFFYAEYNVSCEDLPRGVYFLEVRMQGGLLAREKFVKM